MASTPAPRGDVAALDWERRHRLMRMHTALHLLSVVLPYPVTGGSVGEDKGRLDFDMPEAPDNLAELEAGSTPWSAATLPVTSEWITDDEMAANPGLIKTMKVKPPMGQGRVRLIRIGDVDLQPCGGTHVRQHLRDRAAEAGQDREEGRAEPPGGVLFA